MNRAVLLSVLFSVSIAAPAAERVRYQLKEDTKVFGFIPAHTIPNAESVFPFNKPYAGLSATHQALLRSAYVDMSDSDEPPFPVGGLKAIYEPITEGQQQLMALGTFSADVEIDTEGNPVSVAVYRSPSKAATEFVSSILLLTKFKPAICAGSPCKMGFPVRIAFATR